MRISMRVNDMRMNDMRMNDMRVNDMRMNDMRMNDIRMNDMRMNDIRMERDTHYSVWTKFHKRIIYRTESMVRMENMESKSVGTSEGMVCSTVEGRGMAGGTGDLEGNSAVDIGAVDMGAADSLAGSMVSVAGADTSGEGMVGGISVEGMAYSMAGGMADRAYNIVVDRVEGIWAGVDMACKAEGTDWTVGSRVEGMVRDISEVGTEGGHGRGHETKHGMKQGQGQGQGQGHGHWFC